MAEYKIGYTDDRQAKIAQQEALGRQMLHDDFLPTGNVMTFIDPIPPTAEQLYQEQLATEFNEVHEQAILAYKNWGSLTLTQKDTILKNLVKWALWKDGWLKLGVLD